MQIDLNLNVTVNVNVGLNEAAKGWIMSVQGDQIKAMINEAAGRVQKDIEDLKAQIEAGKTNGLTPAEMADLKTQLDQIDPTTPTVLPAAPG